MAKLHAVRKQELLLLLLSDTRCGLGREWYVACMHAWMLVWVVQIYYMMRAVGPGTGFTWSGLTQGPGLRHSWPNRAGAGPLNSPHWVSCPTGCPWVHVLPDMKHAAILAPWYAALRASCRYAFVASTTPPPNNACLSRRPRRLLPWCTRFSLAPAGTSLGCTWPAPTPGPDGPALGSVNSINITILPSFWPSPALPCKCVPVGSHPDSTSWP